MISWWKRLKGWWQSLFWTTVYVRDHELNVVLSKRPELRVISRRYKRYLDSENHAILNSPCSDTTLALMMGRTKTAIRNQRSRLRRRKKQ